MQYNFYDFDIDHPDISVYDIHQCNIEGKWKHFTLQFPGKKFMSVKVIYS